MASSIGVNMMHELDTEPGDRRWPPSRSTSPGSSRRPARTTRTGVITDPDEGVAALREIDWE
ncbi:hypothetical protein AB0H88_46960 [Nonomuraea sp. NPDC050680]|uniref:hypothetical protein n=1 Tax=Nonomuraea sp. NPDC050680 TaxID=3154630 RepID=UPI0033E9437F